MHDTKQTEPTTDIEATSTAVERERTLEEWATIIRGDMTSVFQGMVNIGRHLITAKSQHPGTFANWLNSGAIGIGRARAYQFIAMARKLGDFQHVGNLPTDSVALYELTRLDRRQLTEAVRAGRVTPNMDRAGAKELVSWHRSEVGLEQAPPEVPRAQPVSRSARPEPPVEPEPSYKTSIVVRGVQELLTWYREDNFTNVLAFELDDAVGYEDPAFAPEVDELLEQAINQLVRLRHVISDASYRDKCKAQTDSESDGFGTGLRLVSDPA